MSIDEEEMTVSRNRRESVDSLLEAERQAAQSAAAQSQQQQQQQPDTQSPPVVPQRRRSIFEMRAPFGSDRFSREVTTLSICLSAIAAFYVCVYLSAWLPSFVSAWLFLHSSYVFFLGPLCLFISYMSIYCLPYWTACLSRYLSAGLVVSAVYLSFLCLAV